MNNILNNDFYSSINSCYIAKKLLLLNYNIGISGASLQP